MIRIVDYVGNVGGGVRFVAEMLKVLGQDYPEARFEFVSHGATLDRYRALLNDAGVGIRLISVRPKNYWRKLSVRIVMRILRLLRIDGLRARISTRWYQQHYLAPEVVFDDCDVVWFPWGHWHRLPESCACPVIGTLHDVIPFQIEEVWSADAVTDEEETIHRWITSPARLVVSSKATASAITGLFGTPPERFSVIPLSGEHAAVASPAHALPADWNWSSALFLLCPANAKAPHKNHKVLLEGVAAWGAKHPLVLTGEGADLPKSERGIELRKLAEARGLRIGGDLIPLGYVSNDVYYGLLDRAWALVMPTLAEGGGSFPVYEAMQLGVPVICSDIPVMREMLERTSGEVLWLDPRDPMDLVRALQELEENYERYKARAINQVGELKRRSWRDVACEYWDLIASLASKGQ